MLSAKVHCTSLSLLLLHTAHCTGTALSFTVLHSAAHCTLRTVQQTALHTVCSLLLHTSHCILPCPALPRTLHCTILPTALHTVCMMHVFSHCALCSLLSALCSLLSALDAAPPLHTPPKPQPPNTKLKGQKRCNKVLFHSASAEKRRYNGPSLPLVFVRVSE